MVTAVQLMLFFFFSYNGEPDIMFIVLLSPCENCQKCMMLSRRYSGVKNIC